MGRGKGRQTLIGTQPTGAIEGVVITDRLGDGLSIKAHGRAARLAVVLGDSVIVDGEDVAHEFEAVAVDSYRNLLQGQGWVRVFSNELSCTAVAHVSAVVSAVSHERPIVTVGGERAQFAIVAEDGTIAAVGEVVAREAEAVAVNAYRDFLKANDLLREVRRGPPVSIEDCDGTPIPPRRTRPG